MFAEHYKDPMRRAQTTYARISFALETVENLTEGVRRLGTFLKSRGATTADDTTDGAPKTIMD